jgi:hypothetical protein
MMSSSLSSLPLGSRRGLPLAVLVSLLALGCFNDPKLDPTQTRHCKDDKSCPWSAVCGPNGVCCESADGKTCKVSPAGLDATVLDSPTNHDIAIQETGSETTGTAGQDSGQGTGGAPGWDGSIDMAEDVPSDAPQVIYAEAGAGEVLGIGGVVGTGGIFGTGGAGGTGQIDAPKSDALDAPLGGTGGGTGGSGGGAGVAGQTCQTSATCASGLSCSRTDTAAIVHARAPASRARPACASR